VYLKKAKARMRANISLFTYCSYWFHFISFSTLSNAKNTNINREEVLQLF